MLTDLDPSTESVDRKWIPASDPASDAQTAVVPSVPVAASAPLPPPEGRGPAVSGTKRVLLLEDDTSFRDIIGELFCEIGYTVRGAKSGIEGIQEVLAGDFAVILCDMMMPGLPGDLFYRAVERARPELCKRFIFMTGHRGDAVSNDFIKAVNGCVLLKPFHLDSLLRAVGEIERRNVVREKPPSPAAAVVRLRPDRVSAPPVRVLPDPVPVGVAPCPPQAPIPARPQWIRIESDEQRRGRRIWTSAAVVLASVVLFCVWYFLAAGRSAAALDELRGLEARWAVVAGELQDARRIGKRFEDFANRAAQVTEERKAHHWSSTLQRIVACTPAWIQLRNIRLRRDGSGEAAWLLRIGAKCAGNRLDADAFRLQIQQELEKVFADVVKTRFDEMEDIPAATAGLNGDTAVVFTIVAAIGAGGKPTEESP